MNTRRLVCLPVLLCSAVIQAEDLSCDAEHGKAVTSIQELPVQVLYLLGHAKTGTDGIADIGGKFNPTDVITDRTVPMRRLVGGVMGPSCIRLIVEYGGIGHYQKTQEYRRTANVWLQTAGAELPRAPSAVSAGPGAFADVHSFMAAGGNNGVLVFGLFDWGGRRKARLPSPTPACCCAMARASKFVWKMSRGRWRRRQNNVAEGCFAFACARCKC